MGYSDMWIGRYQKLMDTARPVIGGDIAKLTAGNVMAAFHERFEPIAPELKAAMAEFLETFPHFDRAVDGAYNYWFFAMLEDACNCARDCHRQGLIQ